MKSLTAFNDTAIDNPHVDPIDLVEVHIGTVILYLCDKVFGEAGSECTFNGHTYCPLILSFDTVQHGKIKPQTYKVDPSETGFVIDNSQPIGGFDNFTTLCATHDPHFSKVVRSRIFEGATASGDAIDLFSGHIEDVLNMYVDQVSITVSGYELSLNNKFICDIVDTTTYPGADPDDVSKLLPVVYGQAKKIPFMAVDAGCITHLIEDVTSTETGWIEFSETTGFPNSGTIQINDEQIYYSNKSADAFYFHTRGYNSTSATAHTAGAQTAEVQTEYFYIIGHAIKSFDAIYVSNIRQLATIYTAYTGQPADQHATYPGKACIKFNTLPLLTQQVNLEVDDTIDVADTIAMSFAGSRICHSTDSDIGDSFDVDPGYFLGSAYISSTDTQWSPTFTDNVSENGYSLKWTASILVEDMGTTGEMYITVDDMGTGSATRIFEIDTGVLITNLNPHTFYVSSQDDPSSTGGFRVYANSSWNGHVRVTLIDVELTLNEYPADCDKTGAASKTGSAVLTGNSVADTVIGGRVTADLQGFQDDGAGTYTGTPNALIERPDHVLKHMLINRCSLLSTQIDSVSYTASGAYYSANSFELAFAILQKPNVRLLINRIANQSKSIEFWEAGKHHLVHIPTTAILNKTLEGNRIDLNQLWIKYTQRIDIANDLSARYHRDWSGHEDSETADRKVVIATDGASVTKYGTLSIGQFSYSYVTLEAQAQAVLNWALSDYANPRLIVEFVGGYYLTDLELGDIISFDFEADSELAKAMLGLVTTADKFRILDKTTRPDAAIQIQAIKV